MYKCGGITTGRGGKFHLNCISYIFSLAFVYHMITLWTQIIAFIRKNWIIDFYTISTISHLNVWVYFVITYIYFPLIQGYRIEDIYILFIIFLFLLRKKIFDCLWISVADCSDLSPFCSDWQQKGECTKNPAYMDDNCKKACGKCSKSNHIFISCNQFICVRWLGYMEYCFHIEMYL